VKNCDRGLENAALGLRPRAAFSSTKSQSFTIWTDSKPANNMFIFFPAVNWFYRLQMGLFTHLRFVLESAYAPSTDDLQKSSQRAGNSDSRQRKMY